MPFSYETFLAVPQPSVDPMNSTQPNVILVSVTFNIWQIHNLFGSVKEEREKETGGKDR